MLHAERNPQSNAGWSDGHAQAGTDAPIDLVHLARQSLGNRSLEQEILALFRSQSKNYVERITQAADAEAMSRAAHTLRGSALSVGAWHVAHCAKALELGPSSPALVERMREAMDACHDYIGALLDG